MSDATARDADGEVDVFTFTGDQFQAIARTRLAELGITWPDIRARHDLRNMDVHETKWWMTFGASFDETWAPPAGDSPTPAGPGNTDPVYLAILDALDDIPTADLMLQGKVATVAANAARLALTVEERAGLADDVAVARAAVQLAAASMCTVDQAAAVIGEAAGNRRMRLERDRLRALNERLTAALASRGGRRG